MARKRRRRRKAKKPVLKKPRDLGALAAIQRPGAGAHQKPRDLPEAEHIRRSEEGEA